jgi:hypothetical protein
VSAIKQWYSSNRLGPLPRNELYERVRRGLHNIYASEVATPKAPISESDMLMIGDRMDLSDFDTASVWCAMVFAWNGLLRVSEFCDGGLKVSDVRVYDSGVQLIIPFSKTSLVPTCVSMVKRDDVICPMLAIKSYVNHFKKRRQPSASFFLFNGGIRDLTRDAFVTVVKGCVRAMLERDPSLYSGHSFRRGGTTAMYERNVPEALIAAHGRWLSLTHRKYMHFDGLLSWRPTSMLLTAKTAVALSK